jgi:DNA polymerase-3 subunit epsilon
MRKLILDTETTGLNKECNRIIEIGIIETVDNIPTGNYFHKYINPQMKVSEESYKICGLSNEFLFDKPFFNQIVEELNEFLSDTPIVAHNANFDIGFLNMERELLGIGPLKNEVVDTLKIARKIFPGASNSLDALCKRFKVNLYKRHKHGALLDAELLTKIYFYLLEKQSSSYTLLEEDLIEEVEDMIVEFNRTPLIYHCLKDEEKHLENIKKFSFLI